MYLFHRFCIIKCKLFLASITFLFIWHKSRHHHNVAELLGLPEYFGINELAHIAITEYGNLLARTTRDGLAAGAPLPTQMHTRTHAHTHSRARLARGSARRR